MGSVWTRWKWSQAAEVGEKDMYKVLNKQGRRYCLRPQCSRPQGWKVRPGIFQLGPFKIHWEQCFRGSGGDVDLQRPEGYSGMETLKLRYGRRESVVPLIDKIFPLVVVSLEGMTVT